MGRFDITRTITLARAGVCSIAVGLLLLSAAPASAQVDTDLSIGGGVRIGWTADTCAAGIAGAIRYNSASSGTVDLCNGTAWITVGTGASGTPAGATREIQFNSGGSFAATSRMTYDGDGAIYIQGDSADGYNTYALVKAGGAGWNTNYITGQKSGGTLASPSNIGWPDTLLVISGDGWGNGAFYGAAEIRFETDGNTGFADMPGMILFRTTPDGTSGLQDRMKIGNQGDVTMYGTGALKIHSGTTAERPGTPANGMVRYNTTTGKFEGYQAGAWVDVIGGGGGSIDALSDGKSDYTADFNLWLGQNAGNAIASGGIGNLAIGQDAADALTTGDDNLAIGQEAMSTLTTGTSNVAIGRYAMRSGDATASENTYVGVASGQNVTGQYNTALGFATLSGSGGITGSNNVALGRDAMRYKEGSYNVAVGADAMANGNGGSVADGNTAVGNVALQAVTEGDGNTAIGSDAGLIVSTGSNNTLIGFLAADALTTGSSNIIIGANTDAPSATGSNQLNIGDTIYGDLSTDSVRIGGAGAVSAFSDLELAGTLALKVSSGTTAQAPGTPVNGMIRYDTTLGKFRAYQAGAWTDMIGGGGGSIDGLSRRENGLCHRFQPVHGHGRRCVDACGRLAIQPRHRPECAGRGAHKCRGL